MSETNSNQRSADADLLTRVGIALTLRLRHTLHAVHIQVDRGTVTLRGMVPTFYDRQLTIEVTRRVAGVLRGLFLSLAILLAAGCGEAAREKLPVYPAKGSITFKGQPIPGAMITLHPTTPVENVPNPQANVAKDGTFSIKTYGAEEGAPEGDYKLTVLWYKPIANGPDFTSGPNVIPPKFTKPETTDIQVKIAAGQNDLPTIQL